MFGSINFQSSCEHLGRKSVDSCDFVTNKRHWIATNKSSKFSNFQNWSKAKDSSKLHHQLADEWCGSWEPIIDLFARMRKIRLRNFDSVWNRLKGTTTITINCNVCGFFSPFLISFTGIKFVGAYENLPHPHPHLHTNFNYKSSKCFRNKNLFLFVFLKFDCEYEFQLDWFHGISFNNSTQ